MKTPTYQAGGKMEKYKAAISKMTMEQLQKAAKSLQEGVKSGKMSEEEVKPIMKMMQMRAEALQKGK